MAVERISRNLNIDTVGLTAWCREKIKNADTVIRKGKNWYVHTDKVIITINAQSYTIITAHKEKIKKGDSLDGVYIIKKIDDVPELKGELIAAFDKKSHKEAARYSLLLAEHILSMTNTPCNGAIEECFAISRKWQEGKAEFQEARQAAFKLHRLAREEKDPIKVKVLRVLGQVAATPHVKRHALIASDYAITLINLLYPKNIEEVKKERKIQIELMLNS
jgi:hypothetical protein